MCWHFRLQGQPKFAIPKIAFKRNLRHAEVSFLVLILQEFMKYWGFSLSNP
ncbi:hypothetical protein NC99_28740 [Sunxiuqinia dokdonensis]|uniref:Uncharacterized protein n=1 Tax=Sunxiuqinia dokdonensis TaxID=1409788 RepID=A0A0L8V814_9BACT|nr:hypothetical protein NC99_28740 [Sunxiuqinia dokdonensis]